MKRCIVWGMCLSVGLAVGSPRLFGAVQSPAGGSPSAASGSQMLLSSEEVAHLLPPSVYYLGKTAPLQLRNASAVRFVDGSYLWASLVDSSGYATDVQEAYQFYLVTERAITFGGKTLPAGAYGGGFVADHFALMDPGGHTVLSGSTQTDDASKRPRPLVMILAKDGGLRLYLGRKYVGIAPLGK